MAAVAGLGHIGIYVRDIQRMASFYRDFLGMQVTKRAANGQAVFLSSDPDRVDHEIALMSGRPNDEDPHVIQQISLRVNTLDDLRDFHRRLKRDGYRIQSVVTHLSAIGCYFLDPEGNNTEVFWVTGRPSWINISVPVDLDRPDADILADIDRVWEQTRHVPMGSAPDEATLEVIENAKKAAAPVGAS